MDCRPCSPTEGAGRPRDGERVAGRDSDARGRRRRGRPRVHRARGHHRFLIDTGLTPARQHGSSPVARADGYMGRRRFPMPISPAGARSSPHSCCLVQRGFRRSSRCSIRTSYSGPTLQPCAWAQSSRSAERRPWPTPSRGALGSPAGARERNAGSRVASGGRLRVVFAFAIAREQTVEVELLADPARLGQLELVVLDETTRSGTRA